MPLFDPVPGPRFGPLKNTYRRKAAESVFNAAFFTAYPKPKPSSMSLSLWAAVIIYNKNYIIIKKSKKKLILN